MEVKAVLNDIAVNEFIEIYSQEFGVELTFKEAEIKANKLFRLLKQIHKNSNKFVKDKNKNGHKSGKNEKMPKVQ